MQIERRANRWPYVGALIGLLIFSLTVPRYWTAPSSKFPDGMEPSDFSPIGEPGCWPSGPIAANLTTPFPRSDTAPIAGSVRFDWTTLSVEESAAPSIEELFAMVNARAHAVWYGNEFEIDYDRRFAAGDTSWRLPVLDRDGRALSAVEGDGRSTQAAAGAPVAVAVLYRIGRVVAEYFWEDIAHWTARLASWVRVWTSARPFAAEEPVLPLADDTRPVDSDELDSRFSSAPQVQEFGDRGRGHCRPDALLEQLARLAQQRYSARWAQETRTLVIALTDDERARPELTAVLLRRLASSAEESVRLADSARDDRLRAELLRAHWGLARRLDRWSVVNDIRIAAVARARVASRGTLTGMFDGPPLAEAPDHIHSFSADLEAYEGTRDPALARTITRSQRELQSSPDALERSLAGAVEQHYRNANVRIAVTAELLNRLVAGKRAQADNVRDRIAGTPVYGTSNTLSESQVLLVPDTGRWRMEIEADGVVKSDTTSDGGMARLYSQGATDFVARKSIVVEPGGVRMEPASVTTYNRNRLVGVTTDFDWVPLVGSLARDRARKEYRANRARAKAEVEVKVATRAMRQLDREAAERVAKFEDGIRARFAPFKEAGVTLSTVEMLSTSERLVARLRLAGEYQLAGHTPRPRALSDSLASVQLHETALTNAAVGLQLDGKRYTAPELQATLREKFPRLSLEAPRDADASTIFQFAYTDAVAIHIADGRLEMALALDEFQHDGRRIRNFVVHAFYVPVVNGLEVELARDGALGFEGRISSADRARLHNVFNEVLSEERRLPLVRLENHDDERLAGFMVTQLVLEDGWLGMAIGPEEGGRVAERTRSLR